MHVLKGYDSCKTKDLTLVRKKKKVKRIQLNCKLGSGSDVKQTEFFWRLDKDLSLKIIVTACKSKTDGWYDGKVSYMNCGFNKEITENTLTGEQR